MKTAMLLLLTVMVVSASLSVGQSTSYTKNGRLLVLTMDSYSDDTCYYTVYSADRQEVLDAGMLPAGSTFEAGEFTPEIECSDEGELEMDTAETGAPTWLNLPVVSNP